MEFEFYNDPFADDITLINLNKFLYNFNKSLFDLESNKNFFFKKINI